MTLKTYDEVADKNKLDPKARLRYLEYMKIRWKETEEQKCKDGYADEWAKRFKAGIEYSCSDEEGEYILKEIIDKK